MQLKTRSHVHATAPATAPVGPAVGTRVGGPTTARTVAAVDTPAPARPADRGGVRAPTPTRTTTFAVVQTPVQEQVVDERGMVLGVWDRSTGLGWVLGAGSLVDDGIDWFLASVRGRSPLDSGARRALAEVRAMDHR